MAPKKLVGFVICSLLVLGCKKKTPERIGNPLKSSITIIKPIKNSQMLEDSSLNIEVSYSDEDKKITKVDFYIDQQYLGSDIYPPFEFVKANISINSGTHLIYVKALDKKNETLCVDSSEFKAYEVRSKYFGNFNFKVHLTSYGGIYPPKDSLYYYQGLVKAFEYADYAENYFNKKSINIYHKRILTINFSKDLNIVSDVKESGLIEDTNLAPHSYQTGQFLDGNNLYFKIGSGGLGGGYMYEVSATRL